MAELTEADRKFIWEWIEKTHGTLNLFFTSNYWNALEAGILHARAEAADKLDAHDQLVKSRKRAKDRIKELEAEVARLKSYEDHYAAAVEMLRYFRTELAGYSTDHLIAKKLIERYAISKASPPKQSGE